MYNSVSFSFVLCGLQAWAVASGKFNEFPNNKAKWKTNFRCALNNLTKHFRMIKDNSKNNSEDPHKIYEIIKNECKIPFVICNQGSQKNVSSIVYCN